MQWSTARYSLPQFVERTSEGPRTVDPYSKLLEERIVLLGTAIDDASASDLIAQLMHLEAAAPQRPICLYINSPGGSFSAMTSIYDTMQYVTCEVETVCLGQAASTAAVLLAAGTPGRRLALPHSRVLIQQPELTEPVQGAPSDLEIHANEMLRNRERLERLLARHSGQTKKRVSQDIERRTVFDAKSAVDYGLVDLLTLPRGHSGSAGLGG